MKGNGRIARCMEKGNTAGQMGKFMSENIRTKRRMATGCSHGQIIGSIKENGRKGRCMGLESLQTKRERLYKGSGLMERGSGGSTGIQMLCNP